MPKFIGQQEVRDLRQQGRDRRGPAAQRSTANGAEQDRLLRVLAPGLRSTTHPGSLYDTLLRHLAQLGNLPLQQFHFRAFERTPGAQAARKLLNTIGVERAELEQAVFTDELFREYQRHKTGLLKQRAARGDAHARAVLNDAKISNGRGSWKGDIEEALEQLHGARNPASWARSRKYRILRNARLMSCRGTRDDGEVVYLYPRRYHKLFLRARTLAGE